eukprot:CAMPEP_0177655314 /NCGR_PEP_ID=MMETSP0447-20121125/14889_1 /TAXON_ID=0 /ORGANISM="Stygamoeba regulata, Strain BSH-02190019" /LENGTH=245 /DNA_ID=CAMNT_0019159201 /DNA_START=20 /DNA_END=757 /DNA_ORIENTATION=-
MATTERPLVGIVGGSGLQNSSLLEETTREVVHTDHGDVVVFKGEGFVFLERHHSDPNKEYAQPHRVPYVAHAAAFKQLGVTVCYLITSTGSLQPSIEPGTCVVVDDFFLFNAHPISRYTDHRSHLVPTIDEGLRANIFKCAKELDMHAVDGTYVSAPGPRFETKAEIRFLATVGHVVGMTAAHEVPLFCEEPAVPVAVVSMTDNWANGIGSEALTPDEYKEGVKRNHARVLALVRALIALHVGSA